MVGVFYIIFRQNAHGGLLFFIRLLNPALGFLQFM